MTIDIKLHHYDARLPRAHTVWRAPPILPRVPSGAEETAPGTQELTLVLIKVNENISFMHEQLNIAITKGATMPAPPTHATTRTIVPTRGKVGRLDHEGSCRFYSRTTHGSPFPEFLLV